MQSKVRERRQDPRIKEGKALIPSAAISEAFGNAMVAEIDLFWRDIQREIKAVFKESNYTSAMDASVTTQAKVRIAKLREKWTVRFNTLAREAVNKMIARVDKNSLVTLNVSLREVAKGLEIDKAYSDQRLIDIIQASTQEAAQLIKRIPSQYLDQVQGEVMRSITSGRGMQDLVPFMAEKYKGDVRWARHVALDQTRKVQSSINRVRLQKFGCEEFTWIHTAGSRYPRKDHIAMSGKVYRFDDPPVIDKRTGQKGFPSEAPLCRCVLKPRFRFGKDESADTP